MLSVINRIPLVVILALSLSVGLAPFYPQPHVLEKVKMLVAGELSRPMDIFDLFFHGSPWVLLVLKVIKMRNSE